MSAFEAHTVRFFLPEPKAIHCAALDADTKRLAISRSDGSVELWQTAAALAGRGAPFCHARLPATTAGAGGATCSVEALAWCGGRLFSTGLHGHVLEHGGAELQVTASTSVTGGAAWCLAAEPAGGRRLAVGTEDGHVLLQRLADDRRQQLTFEKRLTKQERRILCVAWAASGRYLAAGSVNAVCLHDADSGSQLSRITVGRRAGQKQTIVWSVALLPDLTVVTGDSRGRVSFWAGRLGALRAAFTCHRADVLAVAAAPAGRAVYAAGADPTLVRFERTRAADQWVRSARVTLHVRDVRVLVPADRWLISAGADAELVFDVVGSNKETIRTSPLPQAGYVLPTPRLPGLLTVSGGALQLWRLPAAGGGAAAPTQLLQLVCRPGERLVCAAAAPDASWLAYSTDRQLRLHRLDATAGQRPSLQRARSLPPAAAGAAVQLRFHADRQLVILTAQQRLVTLQLAADDQQLLADDLGPVRARPDGPHDSSDDDDSGAESEPAAGGGGGGGGGGALHLMTVSDDGACVALADGAGGLLAWHLTERRPAPPLARARTPVTAMAFRPGSQLLVAVHADRSVTELAPLEGRSRPLLGAGQLPPAWLRRRLPVTQLVFGGGRMVMHDDAAVCAVDAAAAAAEVRGKRARAAVQPASAPAEVGDCVHIADRYRHLLHVSSLEEGEGAAEGRRLLVVEAPAAQLEQRLPPPLRRKRFGAA